MNLRLHTKKFIDNYLGTPLLILTDILALAIGIFLRRNHGIEPVRTILIMKFQGMGSLVLAKPALSHLRKKYPDAHIIFWGTPGTIFLAKEMPEFDEVILLDDRSLLKALRSVIPTMLRFWRLGIDWVFDLEVYSKLSSVLATYTCARNRIGFAVDTVRHRRYAHTHLVLFNRYEYLGQAYFRLLGLLFQDDKLSEEQTATFGDWKFKLDPLPALQGHGKYIVANIHTGELCFERKWPLEYFSVVIHDFLNKNPDYSVVLIGYGKFEIAETQKIPPHERIIHLAGKLTLSETIRCLGNAELVISNDSAPLHLALATKAPVLGLFGPTRPGAYFMGLNSKSTGLTKNIYCSPCVHHWEPPPCLGNNQCMKQLSVTEVLSTMYRMLELPGSPAPSIELATKDESYYPGLVYERKGTSTLTQLRGDSPSGPTPKETRQTGASASQAP